MPGRPSVQTARLGGYTGSGRVSPAVRRPNSARRPQLVSGSLMKCSFATTWPKCALTMAACLGLYGIAPADDAADFHKSAAAVLERHCVSCHQGAEPKGGLDLTTSKAALAG